MNVDTDSGWSKLTAAKPPLVLLGAAGPVTPPERSAAATVSSTATARATATAPAVTRATVTGYKSGSAFLPSSGPVTVVLRGAVAARLRQVLDSLPEGGTMACMENMLLYNITFSFSSPRKTVDAAGYACVTAVQVTQDGKTTLRTDRHCTLLAAVRKVLPASAVTTRQGC